jgi:hypothetical protein
MTADKGQSFRFMSSGSYQPLKQQNNMLQNIALGNQTIAVNMVIKIRLL